MSQEPEVERSGLSIARASKRKWGYAADQVDAFLERAHALYESDEETLTQRDIQNVSFDLAKGGYDIVQVDAALSRLERAVVDKQTTQQIVEHGRVAWKAQTEELYRQLAAHAARESGARFKRGQRKHPSYDVRQVDRLIDDVMDKAAADLGVDGAASELPKKLAELKSVSVSGMVFTQRKGKRGYDERQVDFFLNSCVQLLSRIESYARVADYVQSDGEAAPAVTPPTAAAESGVPSLFSPEAQYRQPAAPASDMPQSYAPAPAAPSLAAGESFDALHEAERAIFAAPAAASPFVAPQPAPAPSFSPTAATEAVPSVPVAPVAQAPADAAPTFAPTVPAAPMQTGAAAPAAPVVDSSLAQLAQLAEATQHTAAAPASFQPKVPDLPTGSVGLAATAPAAPVPPVASPAPTMPATFAQPVATPPLERTDAMTMPASFAASSDAPSAASATTSFTMPSAPAAPAPAPSAPSAPGQSSESAFPTLFPQMDGGRVDVDIPDLSFPSLYGNDDAKPGER